MRMEGAIPPYPGYAKVPDFVTMDRSGVAMAVGETKVPWVAKHSLDTAIHTLGNGGEGPIRHLLG